MNNGLLRAQILISQSRWDMAQGELRSALAADGQNPELHRLLAFCLCQAEEFERAEEEARTAIGLAPDSGACHRMLAIVLADRHKYAAAAVAAEQAIAFDPFDVEAFGTLARVRYSQEDWQGMLAASEQGLAIEPENTGCNNLRAMALVKLGRRAEAGQTLDAALAREPANAFTHANRGWSMLEAGKPQEALDHFRESLAFDPEMEWGRAGIVESLKSRNIIYRWLLRYFLWIAKLSPRARWGVVLGGYFLFRALFWFAESHPAAEPYCMPVVYAYAAFALLTWLGQPLFNLLLFTDKLGRRALSPDQKLQAVSIGGVLLAALTVAVATAWVFAGEGTGFGYESVIYIVLVTIPMSAIFACKPGWPRTTMALCTAAMALIAMVPIAFWFYAAHWPIAEGGAAIALLHRARELFVPGLIGSQFLAMALSQVNPVR